MNFNLQQIAAQTQLQMLQSTAKAAAQPTVAPKPIEAKTNVGNQSTTAATATAFTAPVSIYNVDQLKGAADQAVAASQQYIGSAQAVQPAAKKAAKDVQDNAAEFKKNLDASTNATLEGLTGKLQAELAANQLNSESLAKYKSVVNDDELIKAQELATADLTQATTKLAEAQMSGRNGSFLDSVVAAFKVPIYQQQVQNAQGNLQGINAAKVQATAQLMQDLEVNTRLAHAPYADEIARAKFTEDTSMALASKAMNNIKITGEEFNALGQTLNIDKEVLSAYKSKLDVMMQAGNASTSLYSSLLQEMSFKSAELDFQKAQKAFGDEKQFYDYHTAGFEAYAEGRGIDSTENFTLLMQQAQKTGQIPQVLGEYLLHNSYKENSGGSAVSRYVTSLGSQKPLDSLAKTAYTFVQEQMPIERERITAMKTEAALATKKTGEQLNAEEKQRIAAEVEQEMQALQITDEKGQPNFKAIGQWDRKFSEYVTSMNTDTSKAIQSGMVNLGDLKTKLKSPAFNAEVARYVPADVMKFINEQADSTLVMDLAPGKPAGPQLTSNITAMIGALSQEKMQDNAFLTDYVKKVSQATAATYKANRVVAGDAYPQWQRTIVKLSNLGAESSINIENASDLEQQLWKAIVERRKGIASISNFGRKGPAPTQN